MFEAKRKYTSFYNNFSLVNAEVKSIPSEKAWLLNSASVWAGDVKNYFWNSL